MLKDRTFKLVFIPLLGCAIPYVSGFYQMPPLTFWQLVFSLLFFVGVSFTVWQGALRLMSYVRFNRSVRRNIFIKLCVLLLTTVLYGICIVFLSSALWQLLILKKLLLQPLLKAVLISATAIAVITLVYESVFLNAERELDTIVLQQLDKERMQAEINVLQNELDPHFFFNCLSALSHLVKHEQDKAAQFIQNLSNVYKYFLLNKQKDFVPLKEEIDFLDNYYCLLQMRYDNNIRIENAINPLATDVQILPCTLQVLVENAIKHNFFSEKEPLVISIRMSNYCVIVSNPIRPKLYNEDSTKIGLQNLKTRYRLIMNKNIIVQTTNNKFLVKLPIVKTT